MIDSMRFTISGILSTLQLDEKATTETDVNGDCATEITTTEGKIVKSKTLSDCTNRAVSDVGLESSSLNKEMKPLSSKSVCAYEVRPSSFGFMEYNYCLFILIQNKYFCFSKLGAKAMKKLFYRENLHHFFIYFEHIHPLATVNFDLVSNIFHIMCAGRQRYSTYCRLYGDTHVQTFLRWVPDSCRCLNNGRSKVEVCRLQL